jgi:hypothetical protein
MINLAFLLLALAAADPVQPNRAGCERSINDAVANCDDGIFKIELPLCALEQRRINPATLFMSK